jgi:hypothetical protein
MMARNGVAVTCTNTLSAAEQFDRIVDELQERGHTLEEAEELADAAVHEDTEPEEA